MSSSTPAPKSNAPYSHELIEKEIEHLKKRTGTRSAQEIQRGWSKFLVVCAVLGLFWLWGMDAVLFSYNRGDAIHDYLYLHNYGNDAKARALAASGLLTPGEVKQLNARQGAFQDYYAGTEAAEKQAAELIDYMDQVRALHQSQEETLSPLNKVRYFLFMKTGLIPPTRWDVLNSSIDK